jgi:hypothetical protein
VIANARALRDLEAAVNTLPSNWVADLLRLFDFSRFSFNMEDLLHYAFDGRVDLLNPHRQARPVERPCRFTGSS